MLFEQAQTDVAVSAADTVNLNREIDAEATRNQNPEFRVLNPELSRSLQLILGSFRVADRYLKQSLANLKPVELDRLLASAPVLWGDEDDSSEHYLKGALHREFNRAVDTAMKFDTDTVLPILRRIDRRALALSGLAVSLAANRARVLLTDATPSLNHDAAPAIAESVGGGVIFSAESEWGESRGRRDGGQCFYAGDFSLVIDFRRETTATPVAQAPVLVCFLIRSE